MKPSILFGLLTAVTTLAAGQPAGTTTNAVILGSNLTAPPQLAPSTSAPPIAATSTNTAEPPITSENGTNGLRMNFRGAPLNLVLDYLSDAAGFIINKTTDIHGTVEVWSKQPVSKDEAVELLSSVLKKNGYAVTRNGRILTILALDTAKTSSELEVVSGNNPDEVEKSDEIQTRIIAVHYANATQLVPNLELLLPTTATLSANESANTLILVATKSDIKRMLKIVQALDTSIASVSTIKVRPLLYADAKDTANLITQLFTSQSNNQNNQGNRGGFNFGGQGGPGGFGGFGGGGGGGGFRAALAQAAASANTRSGGAGAHVVAVADDRSNALVISAPPDLMPTIEDMLKEIDRQVADETELRVFRLTNADPSELADQLAQLFPDDSSSNNNNNNQNVPFFFRGRFGPGNNTPVANGSERAKKLGKVLAVPDPRTSALIVTASKTLMPQIAEMIAELDADKGKREVVSYYELQNADPQDVSQNLQDLFNRSTVRMQNNNNQNTFLGRNNPLTQRQTQNQQSTSGSSSSLGGSSRSTTSRFGQ
jgi:type II secretory pathway component GspD/PulD (secretin)